VGQAAPGQAHVLRHEVAHRGGDRGGNCLRSRRTIRKLEIESKTPDRAVRENRRQGLKVRTEALRQFGRVMHESEVTVDNEVAHQLGDLPCPHPTEVHG
jgi:hypothetical protein